MTEAIEGMTSDDLYQMRWAGDAQLSPDGSEVVYVVTAIDREEDDYTADLWIAPVEGGKPRRFTAGEGSDTSPRWSPDGSRLLFVSDRSGKKQLYIIDRDGGEARQLTTVDGGVTSPTWSPDGTRIAFVSREAECIEEEDEDDNGVRVIDRLRYKLNGRGWWDGKWAQVFVVDVDGGEPEQVTAGSFDHSFPEWSPNGEALVAVADREEDADYTMRSDLWLFELADPASEPVKLTRGMGPAAAPAWSEESGLIAYIGHDAEYSGATSMKLYLADPQNPGSTLCLTADFDRSLLSGPISDMGAFSSPSGLQWGPTGDRIFFTAPDGGTTKLYSVDVSSRELRRELAGDRVLLSVNVGQDGATYAAVATTPQIPADVFTGTLGGSERRLTQLNEKLLSERNLAVPESLSYEGADGREIEGWIMYPPEFEPESGERVPMILQIHGGPHGAYGLTFFHEFQLMAARGYAVLFTNPHGSRGYGQEFTAATHHDWGGKDYQDLMKGVDHALSLGTVDEQRLGVAGGSFGGYMTNWAIGHTDRFKAAVTMRSTCNRYSMFTTNDIGFMHGSFEFDGNPWDNPDMYLKHSPITYVENVDTPLLMIHSENDHRCPIEQAEQFFTALKWLKKEVQLVIFPNEHHGLSRQGKPEHRVERLDRIMEWFDEWIGGE